MSPIEPTGLAGDLDADAGADRGQRLAGEAQALAGEELEDLRGAHGLADALGEGLALLAGEQPAELVLAGEDLGGRLVRTSWRCSGPERPTRPGRPPWRRRSRARASSAVPRAYSPTTSSVFDGLRFGAASPPTHSPSMRLLVCQHHVVHSCARSFR